MYINVIIFWILFSAILILIETSFISGLGFLFAGLSAITTAGFIIFKVISFESYSSQLAIFMVFTVLWGGLLWNPIKKLRKTKSGYNNIVGDVAQIYQMDLLKHQLGKARWSGTIMNATMVEDDPLDRIKTGSIVRIVDVKGNSLIVSSDFTRELKEG